MRVRRPPSPWVRELYRVEDDAVTLTAGARHVGRRAHSARILARIDQTRRALAETVLPKSPLGDALRYLANQWAATFHRPAALGSPLRRGLRQSIATCG
jgi:hypothetical protein